MQFERVGISLFITLLKKKNVGPTSQKKEGKKAGATHPLNPNSIASGHISQNSFSFGQTPR